MTGPERLAPGETIPAGYRDVRMARGPVVSVVVVASGAAPLARSLARLARDCGRRGVELVAVHGDADPADAGALQAAYPGVRFVPAPGRVSGSVLRQRGLAAAEGDIVVFADDVEAAAPGWLEERLGRWPVRSANFRGADRPSDDLTTASSPVR